MEILLSSQRKKWSMNGITYYYKSGKLCQCKSRNARLVTGKKKDGTLLVPTPELSQQVFLILQALEVKF